RGGAVDARPGAYSRCSPPAHHSYRGVHAGVHSRPPGPVRTGRGRGARAGARRAACAVSREWRRGRREPRVARAPHPHGGCGRFADASAPAPFTGVHPVSQPESAIPVGPPSYEPRRPTLIATAAFPLWPLLLSLPMFTGMWLASPWSDQYTAGLPFHAWSAEWLKRSGHLPLW